MAYNYRRLIVAVLVILIYFTAIEISFTPIKISQTSNQYYAYLTKSFLLHQLNLPITSSPHFFSLENPYDFHANMLDRGTCYWKEKYMHCIKYVHDLSYFNNKFYLYFGPLPVLVFYLPFKVLTSYYPSDSLALLFFLSIGFLIQFRLLIKIKEKFFASMSEHWLLLAGFVLGIANNSAFLIVRPLFYEVAIASAFCFMSLGLFFLYKVLLEKLKIRNIIFFSLFVSLSVAGRPNFSLVCIMLVVFLSIYFYKTLPRNQLFSGFSAVFVPALTVASILGAYNFERYHSIFEFGQSYLLAGAPQSSFLDLSSLFQNIKNGLYFYLFQPYFLEYTDKGYLFINKPKSYNLDHLSGIFITTPVTLFIILLPRMLYFNFKSSLPNLKCLAFFLFLISIMSLLILISLCCLNGATQRYVTDFLPYVLLVSTVSFWWVFSVEKNVQTIMFTKIFYVVLAIISIFISVRHAMHLQILPI